MSPFGFSVWELTAALGVTAVAAWVQGNVGFGFALVSVPVLALVDPQLVASPQLLLMVPLTLAMVWRERADVRWEGLLWVLVGRLPGLILGAWLLSWAPPALLDGLVGGLVLAAATLLARGGTWRRTRVNQMLAGAFSGASSIVSAIGGPPIALLYRDERGPALRATLAAIFAVGIGTTLVARWAAGAVGLRDLAVAGVAAPGLALGLALSRRTRAWIEGRRLRRAVLGLAALAAFGLLLRAWSRLGGLS